MNSIMTCSSLYLLLFVTYSLVHINMNDAKTNWNISGKSEHEIWNEYNSKREYKGDQYVKCGYDGCDMYFKQRNHNRHNKRNHDNQDNIVFYHQDEVTKQFTKKVTKKANDKTKKIKANKQKKARTSSQANFMGKFFGFGPNAAKKQKVEPQAVQAAQRDDGCDDCKHKDKQIKELKDKNKSLNAIRYSNMDTLNAVSDRYYHRGLLVENDTERDGYYSFHCAVCDYAFFDGKHLCYEDKDEHIKKTLYNHFDGKYKAKHSNNARHPSSSNWYQRGMKVLRNLFNWCLDSVLDYGSDNRWSDILVRKVRDGNDIGHFGHDHNYLWRFKEILHDVFKILGEYWNKCHQNIETLTFDIEQIMEEYRVMKLRLFRLNESGFLADSFKHNKNEFKLKYKLNMNLHNEVARLFIQNQKLYKDIAKCLTIYTRSESIGASEAKSEGEVKKAKMRLRNRYQLQSKIFGYEHVIQELHALFKYETDDIITKCIKRYLTKYKKNTLRDPSTKSKYKHSATIDKKLAKPCVKEIDKSRLVLDDDLGCFKDEDENDEQND
eukprot:130852_1